MSSSATTTTPTSTIPAILHIVYIHGFQGDHTTFQSFPTDLHNALQPLLPPDVELRSILYPTYKSRRPIAVAKEKFLEWLATLPPGPVILCGHSMGGLLAAQAATSGDSPAAKRVVALVAYDVPFLGMHPHVVVSGIASLLPGKKRERESEGAREGQSSGERNKHGHRHERGESAGAGAGVDGSDGEQLQTEEEMNDARHVEILPAAESSSPSPYASQTSLPPPAPQSRVTSASSGPSLTSPPLPPRPSSASNTSIQTRPRDAPPPFITQTIDFLHAHADDRLVPFLAKHPSLAALAQHPAAAFLTKHRSEPLAAATRYVVESLEFGVCIFDPAGLRERYTALEQWHGNWVAFWTETVPPGGGGRAGGDARRDGEKRVSEMEQEVAAHLERWPAADPDPDSATDGDWDALPCSPSTSLDAFHPSPSATSLNAFPSPRGTGALSPERTSAPSLNVTHDASYASDVPDTANAPAAPAEPPARAAGPMTKAEDEAFRKEAKLAQKEAKFAQKQREKDIKAVAKAEAKVLKAVKKQAQGQHHPHSPHHFVLLPFRPPSRTQHTWERVQIHGAKDEVEAHCGLFLRDVNLEYERFVWRVAEVVEAWVDRLYT